MKIKIVRRYVGDDTVYDAYHGHHKYQWLPFFAEWIPDNSNMSYDELGDYLRRYLGSDCKINIKFD